MLNARQVHALRPPIATEDGLGPRRRPPRLTLCLVPPAAARGAEEMLLIPSAPPGCVSNSPANMQRLRGAAALLRASRAVRQLAAPAVAAAPLAAQSLARLARQAPGASPLAARAFSTKARSRLKRQRARCSCGAVSDAALFLAGHLPAEHRGDWQAGPGLLGDWCVPGATSQTRGKGWLRGRQGLVDVPHCPPLAAVIDGEIKSVSMSETMKNGQWTVLLFYPKASQCVVVPCASALRPDC